MVPFRRNKTSRYRGPALRRLLASLSQTSAGTSAVHRCRAAGFQYDELPDDLLRRIPQWVSSRAVVDGQEIRPGRVYRHGDLLVKFYGPGHAIKDRLRRSPAVRSADWYARLLPIRTPRPLLAIEIRSFGRLKTALLITEFIRGRSLLDLWNDEEPRAREALAAFPAFLAQMHSHRVYHGDLHTLNLLWNDREWVLIDLDGMRRHRTIGRRIIERQWARIAKGLSYDERLRPYFEAYLTAAHLDWNADVAWERIRGRWRGAAVARAPASDEPRPSTG